MGSRINCKDGEKMTKFYKCENTEVCGEMFRESDIVLNSDCFEECPHCTCNVKLVDPITQKILNLELELDEVRRGVQPNPNTGQSWSVITLIFNAIELLISISKETKK